jgi:hypothetical protein
LSLAEKEVFREHVAKQMSACVALSDFSSQVLFFEGEEDAKAEKSLMIMLFIDCVCSFSIAPNTHD